MLLGVTVVLLNLLIAILSDSYEHIKEFERVEQMHGQAQMVVQIEEDSVPVFGQAVFDAVVECCLRGDGEARKDADGFERPRFLHILESVDEVRNAKSPGTGRIKLCEFGDTFLSRAGAMALR